MTMIGLLDSIPLWLLLPLGCLLIAGCCEIGFRLGRTSAKRHKPADSQFVSVATGAVLGFLAFMLAFAFNTAAVRFQERRDVLVRDANAIETTYLRTRLIAEPEAGEIRQLMREYVEVRVDNISLENAAEISSRSDELQAKIWSHAATAAREDRSTVMATFIMSLNEMIDINTKRMAVIVQHRITDWIWISLFVLLVIGVSVLGFQSGLHSRSRSAIVIGPTMAFAIVFVVTVSLDRPGSGMFYVDQAVMKGVLERMHQHP